MNAVKVMVPAHVAAAVGLVTFSIFGEGYPSGVVTMTLTIMLLVVFHIVHPPAVSTSLILVLEGVLVMTVLTVAVMGSQLPSSLIFERVSPASLLIALLWVVGLWLVGRARSDLPWQEKGDAPGGQEEPHGTARHKKRQDAQDKGVSIITRTVIVFAVSAVVTLAAGVVLELSGDNIAGQVGINGVLFGSTLLVAATSLPEVSTGLASVRLGDYKLSVSDIFGGNAFLPVLFLLAGLLSGAAPLPQARAPTST